MGRDGDDGLSLDDVLAAGLRESQVERNGHTGGYDIIALPSWEFEDRRIRVYEDRKGVIIQHVWAPMGTDTLDQKTLGKLRLEGDMTRLLSAVLNAVVRGIDEKHPNNRRFYGHGRPPGAGNLAGEGL